MAAGLSFYGPDVTTSRCSVGFLSLITWDELAQIRSDCSLPCRAASPVVGAAAASRLSVPTSVRVVHTLFCREVKFIAGRPLWVIVFSFCLGCLLCC